MNQREKLLASIVGLTVLVLVGQLGFNKYRGAISAKNTRINTLTNQISDRQIRQLEGAAAEAQMGKYIMRSLPSNLETAQGVYNKFLTELVTDVGLSGASAKFSSKIPMQGLYSQMNFSVSGNGDLKQLVELLYNFHRSNYLHRIQNLVVRKNRGGLVIVMDVQALVLNAALPDAKPPTDVPTRVAADINTYLLPILNRNPVSPPNNPPVYAAERSPEAVAGKDFTYVARFNDPDDGQMVKYELVGESPSGLQLDPITGSIRFLPADVGKYELRVRATDNGWPQKSVEQTLVINAVEPPQEAPPEPEKPKFDEAKQTFLTGLTQSKGQWTAMLLVRTRGETLKLKQGDEFQIGQLTGTVVEVTNSYAILESNGENFTLAFDTSLADAAENKGP